MFVFFFNIVEFQITRLIVIDGIVTPRANKNWTRMCIRYVCAACAPRPKSNWPSQRLVLRAGHAAHLWHAIHHCQIFEQQCAHATPQRVNIIFAASFISRLLIYFPSTETNPIPAQRIPIGTFADFSHASSRICCGPRGRPILAPSLMEPQIDYTLFCIVMDMEAHNGKGARAMQTRRFSKSNRTPLNGAAGVKSWYQKVSNWHSLAFSHTYIYVWGQALVPRGVNFAFHIVMRGTNIQYVAFLYFLTLVHKIISIYNANVSDFC